MVVDDQEGNREVLRMFLSWGGYVVREASDGLEAVNLATKDRPDLIFMDLAMPRMDGFNATRLLRESSETRDVPIVAYTAHDTPDYRSRALRTGFNEFLTKPIDFKTLESVLDRFVDGIDRSPSSRSH